MKLPRSLRSPASRALGVLALGTLVFALLTRSPGDEPRDGTWNERSTAAGSTPPSASFAASPVRTEVPTVGVPQPTPTPVDVPPQPEPAPSAPRAILPAPPESAVIRPVERTWLEPELRERLEARLQRARALRAASLYDAPAPAETNADATPAPAAPATPRLVRPLGEDRLLRGLAPWQIPQEAQRRLRDAQRPGR